MFAGGVLSWLVLLPLLSILGAYINVPFPPIHPNYANNPATGQPFLISEMAPAQLWSAYIRYIGAGAVLAAGLITLGRTIPTIVASARESFRDFSVAGGADTRLRTERDIPMIAVLGGSLLLAVFLTVMPSLPTLRQRTGRRPDPDFRVLLLDRVVAHHRPDRHLVQPDLGHDDRHADPHLPPLCRARLDGRHVLADRAWRRRDRVHRGRERGQHVTGSEDRLHRRRDAAVSADRAGHRRHRLGVGHRPHDPLPAQQPRGHRIGESARRRRRR